MTYNPDQLCVICQGLQTLEKVKEIYNMFSGYLVDAFVPGNDTMIPIQQSEKLWEAVYQKALCGLWSWGGVRSQQKARNLSGHSNQKKLT